MGEKYVYDCQTIPNETFVDFHAPFYDDYFKHKFISDDKTQRQPQRQQPANKVFKESIRRNLKKLNDRGAGLGKVHINFNSLSDAAEEAARVAAQAADRARVAAQAADRARAGVAAQAADRARAGAAPSPLEAVQAAAAIRLADVAKKTTQSQADQLADIATRAVKEAALLLAKNDCMYDRMSAEVFIGDIDMYMNRFSLSDLLTYENNLSTLFVNPATESHFIVCYRLHFYTDSKKTIGFFIYFMKYFGTGVRRTYINLAAKLIFNPVVNNVYWKYIQKNPKNIFTSNYVKQIEDIEQQDLVKHLKHIKIQLCTYIYKSSLIGSIFGLVSSSKDRTTLDNNKLYLYGANFAKGISYYDFTCSMQQSESSKWFFADPNSNNQVAEISINETNLSYKNYKSLFSPENSDLAVLGPSQGGLHPVEPRPSTGRQHNHTTKLGKILKYDYKTFITYLFSELFKIKRINVDPQNDKNKLTIYSNYSIHHRRNDVPCLHSILETPVTISLDIVEKVFLPITQSVCKLDFITTYNYDYNLSKKTTDDLMRFYWEYKWNTTYDSTTLLDYFKLICKYFHLDFTGKNTTNDANLSLGSIDKGYNQNYTVLNSFMHSIMFLDLLKSHQYTSICALYRKVLTFKQVNFSFILNLAKDIYYLITPPIRDTEYIDAFKTPKKTISEMDYTLVANTYVAKTKFKWYIITKSDQKTNQEIDKIISKTEESVSEFISLRTNSVMRVTNTGTKAPDFFPEIGSDIQKKISSNKTSNDTPWISVKEGSLAATGMAAAITGLQLTTII
jgi:hypothetical protein